MWYKGNYKIPGVKLGKLDGISLALEKFVSKTRKIKKRQRLQEKKRRRVVRMTNKSAQLQRP